MQRFSRTEQNRKIRLLFDGGRSVEVRCNYAWERNKIYTESVRVHVCMWMCDTIKHRLLTYKQVSANLQIYDVCVYVGGRCVCVCVCGGGGGIVEIHNFKFQ